MLTYQDLLLSTDKLGFVASLISGYKASAEYKTALEAEAYWRNQNPTINRYQKLLYTVSGTAVPDNYSANFKLATNVYFRFVTQTVAYLLGRGVSFKNPETKALLGGASLDFAITKATTYALNGGVSYCFYNAGRLEVFSSLEFCPLLDEETGRLKAGVRFWRIDKNKPLRATLYEIDGVTELISGDGAKFEVIKPKTAYTTQGNYRALPIIPLYSPRKQSAIIGFKQKIDCYDLIESGFANDVDEASMIYWTISNAGGMDDIDLKRFVEHMRSVKAAVVEDDGAHAESHTQDVPSEAREAILNRLETEMYRDFMVLNTDNIRSTTTATAIKASYEPMNLYSNLLENEITECIMEILALLGVEDAPQFVRELLVNELEQAEVQKIKMEAIALAKDILPDEEVAQMMRRVMAEMK